MTKIIDNKDETLAAILNRELLDVNEVAIATAYFNIRGYGAISEGLGDKPMYLLLGREPTESVKWEDEILRELEDNEDELDYFNLLKKAIDYFTSDRRQIRIVEGRFFHGKAFLGASPTITSPRRGVGVVGSSNFTYGGLVTNRELNMLNTDREVVLELAEWFAEQWSTARDYKKEFISLLSNYIVTRTPYEVIAKALYETYKESFSERENQILKNMYPHQQLSYINAVEKLEKYGGVLIADSTGLGKSMVALNIAHTAIREGKKVLLIAPKSVLDTTWESEMKRTGIHVDTLSTEMLSQDPSCVEEYSGENGVQLVIVDEAHYFRRQSTNRYQALAKLITMNNAQIVLITATPVNTSLMDLYSLFSLYLPEDCIKDVYDGTLRGYFTSNQAKWLRGEPVNMDDVLRMFVVRHSRELAKALDRDGRIRFPKREFYPPEKDGSDRSRYSINLNLQKIYEILDGMKLVFYDLSIERLSGEFRLPDGTVISKEMHPERLENLKQLVKTIFIIGLFKRLESSIAAFRQSLLRLQRYIKAARTYAIKHNYYIPPKMRGDIFSWFSRDDEPEEIPEQNEPSSFSGDDKPKEIPEPAVLFSKQKYKGLLNKCRLEKTEVDTFVKACEEDLRSIDTLLDMLPKHDEKYYALQTLLAEITEKFDQNTNNGAIIFTQYADTANYLYEKLNPIFKRVMLVTGSGGLDEKGNRVDEAEAVSRFQRHGGVLISTDVLSAGQNLQNAQYVVNYDFPWNPVVLIQRAGRVDRLGSPHETIYIVNILPRNGDPDDPNSLEYFLRLMERLYRRLEMIRETIGVDASTLGEEAAPKDFSIQLKIAMKDRNVLSMLEKRIEQFTKDPLDTLARILNEKGLEWVQQIPNGIGAVKHGKFDGLFILFTDGLEHYWRLHNFTDNTIITSPTEITDILMEGDLENYGEPIPYDSLIDKFREAKNKLKAEIEEKRRRDITGGEGPINPTRVVIEIYDALARYGDEGERLAVIFKKFSNKTIIVEQLKKAMAEGRLLEKAREILPQSSMKNMAEKYKTIEEAKLRRVCWCLIKSDANV